MADINDLQNLQGVLLGLGLKDLPNLLMALHKASNAGRNLSEGRSHKDDGPSSQDQAQGGPQGGGYDIQSALAPLLAQLQGAGGGQAPMPVNTPGMRPGMPPAPLPRMQGLPRTMQAGASPAGF
jgi:hypothetical protein